MAPNGSGGEAVCVVVHAGSSRRGRVRMSVEMVDRMVGVYRAVAARENLVHCDGCVVLADA